MSEPSISPEAQAEALHCAQMLRQGKVLLYPTDTVWGLGCDATDEAAIARIYAIKQRPADKSLILLVADSDQLRDYVPHIPEALQQLADEADKPLTVIYTEVIGLPDILLQEGAAAIRIVRDEFCRAMIRALGRPVTSTSANISGMPTPALFSETDAAIRSGVDYAVRYRQDDATRAQPSAIVKLSGDGAIEWIRK